MRKTFLSLILALAVFIPAFAGGEGSVALPFLRINQDPVSAAMGDLSIRNNAASDVWQDGRGYAGFSWQKWAPDASSFLSAGGYGRINDRFAVRAAFSKQSETPYDIYNEQAQPAGSFTPGAFYAGAGLSAKITDRLSAGVNAGYASRQLASDAKLGAFVADAALMGILGDFRLAGGVKAIGSSVEAASGSRYSLPSSLFLSSAYRGSFGEKNAILAGLEVDYFFYWAPAVNAGVEYGWGRMLFVRAGYHYGGLIPNHASAGLGVNLKGACLHFSYLAGSGGIGGSMLIGAGYRF